MTDFTIISRAMTSRLFSPLATILTVAVAVGLLLLAASLVPADPREIDDAASPDASATTTPPVPEVERLLVIIDNMSLLLTGMAGMVMVSGAFSIMLALSNSMEQRKRQFAVLRLLGCSRGRIGSLVLTESAMIGLLGSVVGVAIWLGFSRAAAGLLFNGFGLVVRSRPDVATILMVMMATVALASLAGVVPSIMAGRTLVARTLRASG